MDSSLIKISGILDVNQKGFGFIRKKGVFYRESQDDTFVPAEFIRRKWLRSGLYIEGEGVYGKEGNLILKKIISLNNKQTEIYRVPKPYHKLTTISPTQRIKLETEDGPLSTRVIDLLSPIGKGSRSLIIAPPKVGKTTILKDIANGCSISNPDISIYVLLIDERPEEVTDMVRSIKGQVLASSMDQDLINHTRLCRLTLEIAKRKVEMGEDVLILLDSITRMSRAFNNTEGDSGRSLSGGLDSRAMIFPRSFFGAARNIEHGGSLTIIGTALVDTGSKMDELIFREFQGTGNQEVVLSRRLSNKRVFPAIDIERTRTRKEELLLTKDQLLASTRIRRGLFNLNNTNAMERLIETMKQHDTNDKFIKVLLDAIRE